MRTYPVKLVQHGILTDKELTQDGLLCYQDGECFIDLNEDNVFYKFHDTQSRFYALLEIDEENNYQCFELTLKPDYYLDDFEIEKDQEYKEMVAFLLKDDLNEKLTNKSIKEKKQKI